MKKIIQYLTYCLIGMLILGGNLYKAQTNPYKAPLYWNPYEYHIVKEMAGVQDNYLTEEALTNNINWLDQTLSHMVIIWCVWMVGVTLAK